ncbi:hypothetical protein [Candidatus Nasuia deltocephalinicola]|uniref:hypothetical protein n=1 Tax=Candidatus Nasuia deltocephalincola TaxID=1160784 RepID=UPI00216B1FFE|nr:hypothetical protein [Candidatus Nasuia deltocephalinicola]
MLKIKLKKKKILIILIIFFFLSNKKDENFLINFKNNIINIIFKKEDFKIKLKIKNKKKFKIKKNIYVNLKYFFNIIKKIKNKNIKFYIKNNELKIINNKIIYKIKKIKDEKVYYNKSLKKKEILKKNFFYINKKQIINIINLITPSIKKKNKLNENINFFIKKNILNISIIDNYQVYYYSIILKKNFFKKNFFFSVKIEIIKILEILIKYIKNKLKIYIKNKKIYIKIEKIKIIFLIKNNKIFIIKNLYKKYINYIILTKNVIKILIEEILILSDKKNIFISFEIYNNKLKIYSKNKNDNICCKYLNIYYKNNFIKFKISGENFLNFLKNLKKNNIILNFSKKKSLVITVPQMKGFKYIISIIKI